MFSNMLHHKKYQGGFSLIELIITMAVIGALSSIALFAFNDWQVKSRVGAQVKQMVSDIGELRIRALTTKQRHSITFNPASYVFKSYTSEAESLASGKVIPGGTHTVTYRLQDKNKADFTGLVQYEIDVRGMLASSTASVFLDYKGAATIDCFTLHTTRVNPGKKNATGDTCDDK